MEMRFLGRSGLQVSVLSFGTMTFGAAGFLANVGSTSLDDARRQVDLAIDAGVNLFDTADFYTEGRSEEILGTVLEGRRRDVLIASKVYGRVGEGAHDIGLSRRHIIEACDASLHRLRTDWIDLYQVHNHDGLTPIEETLRALDDLVRAGKVRYIGCSNHFGWQLSKALGASDRLGLERYVSQQVQYSLSIRDIETEILPAGIDQGVGALIWSPLAGGYLTGKFRKEVKESTRIGAWERIDYYDTPRGQSILAALDQIAQAREGATPTQVALNWVRARPGVASVIFGARNEAQLKDNLSAAQWSLDPEEVALLDEVSATPKGYPFSQHAFFHPERNPSPFPASPPPQGR